MKTVLSDLTEDYKQQVAGNMISNYPAYDFHQFKDQQITAKGYMNYFGVSFRTAQRYMSRDKKSLAIPPFQKLRMSHFLALYGDPFVMDGQPA